MAACELRVSKSLAIQILLKFRFQSFEFRFELGSSKVGVENFGLPYHGHGSVEFLLTGLRIGLQQTACAGTSQC